MPEDLIMELKPLLGALVLCAGLLLSACASTGSTAQKMPVARTPEQIKRLLKEADRDLARGLAAVDVCLKLGIPQASYFRWRRRFAAHPDESRQAKELAAEVERLKLLVADLLLEKTILQDVAKKKW